MIDNITIKYFDSNRRWRGVVVLVAAGKHIYLIIKYMSLIFINKFFDQYIIVKIYKSDELLFIH